MDIINHSDLEDKYKTWSDDDLIRALSFEKENYFPQALEIMKLELSKRNIQVAKEEYISTNITLIDGIEAQKLNGITGFLLVFIIIFSFNVLSSLFDGISFVSKTEYKGIFALFSFLNLIIPFYGIYCLILLIGKKKNAIKHTQICLSFGAIVPIIFYIIISQDYEVKIPLLPVGAALWITYLNNSKRVKYTYPDSRGNNLEDSSETENGYICSECGSDVSEVDILCPKCGADITNSEEQ